MSLPVPGTPPPERTRAPPGSTGPPELAQVPVADQVHDDIVLGTFEGEVVNGVVDHPIRSQGPSEGRVARPPVR